MRLTDLHEAVSVWYHGTPESQKIGAAFEQRGHTVRYISDPEKYQDLRKQLRQYELNSPEYHTILNKMGEFNINKHVRSPVFLTGNLKVARTYADPHRAFDYQAAEPRVLRVSVAGGKTLRIDGGGQDFRGITVDAVREALLGAGMPGDEIDQTLSHHYPSIRGSGKLSTNALAAIMDDLGYDIVDVVRVKDNYMGKGPATTVRMVMDPSLIHIIGR